MGIRTALLSTALLSCALTSNLFAIDQDAVIEGARKEGTLVVYTSMSADQVQRTLDVFNARYPFLKTTMFRAVGERLLTKDHDRSAGGKV